MANKGKKKKLIIGLAVALVVVVIIIFNLVRSSEKALEVQAEEVKKGTITSTVSAAGRVQPETEVDISANVSGKIVRLGVKEGDRVQQGQFLVQLDRNRYQALVDQAQAQLTSAQARLVEAEAEYRRAKQLYDANLASEADLEATQARRDVEKANHDATSAYLEKTRDDLSKTTIHAPMAGTVSQLNSEEGEVVLGTEQFSGTVIMTIADLSRMEVETDVDETDIVDVAMGQAVKIEVDALPDTVLEGQVTEIASTAYTLGRGTQEEVTNFRVKIAVLDKISTLRPGMSATVDVETASHEDVLYLPIQCVVLRSPKPPEDEEQSDEAADEQGPAAEDEEQKLDGDEEVAEVDTVADETSAETSEEQADGDDEDEELIDVVFVIQDDVAKMVPVKVGISSDTDMEILSGLEGEELVVTGSYRALRDLRDGQKVKVEEPAEKKDQDED
jgi:HlyD family secretion protein